MSGDTKKARTEIVAVLVSVVALGVSGLTCFEAHRSTESAINQAEYSKRQTELAENQFDFAKQQQDKLDAQQQKLEQQRSEFEKIREEEKVNAARAEFLRVLQEISRTQAEVSEAIVIYGNIDDAALISLNLNSAHAMLVLRAEQLLQKFESDNRITAEEYLVLCQAAFYQGWYKRAKKWGESARVSEDSKIQAAALQKLADIEYAQGNKKSGADLYETAIGLIDEAKNLQKQEKMQIRVQYKIFWHNVEASNGNIEDAELILKSAERDTEMLRRGLFKQLALAAISNIKGDPQDENGGIGTSDLQISSGDSGEKSSSTEGKEQ
ncbi:hypothetical protein AB1L30_14045 [Bremerella sp. JC817]|uniref:hypothetical protein n=1 Tax=Bremerella sp. JC817 TaxID=3231756 RepID=UPI00345AFBEE